MAKISINKEELGVQIIYEILIVLFLVLLPKQRSADCSADGSKLI